MSQQMDCPTLTRDAAETLEKHRLCRFNASGNYVYCDAGEMPVGAVTKREVSGVPVTADLLLNKPGTRKMVAAASFSALAEVYTAADGKISSTNTGVKVGVALEAASGDGSVVEVLPDLKSVAMVNAAASSAVGSSSTTEAAFDVSHTVPAERIKAGTLLRIRASGIVVDQDSTPQCDVRLKVGTETIVTATVGAAADNDQFVIVADVVVRTIGASGTLVALAAAAFDAAGTALGTALKASATEDTTSGLAVTVTGQFNASHADNTVRLDVLEVEVLN